MSIYDIGVESIQGTQQDLSLCKDQVMLIVNVASRCGFTSQYAKLETLYRQYHQQGLVVLGFPCNDFASQEPLDNPSIEKFAKSCFAVTFPMFAKLHVKGEHQAPIYRYLIKHLKQKVILKTVPWNFTKFLVDRHGEVLQRFLPITPWWYVERKVRRALLT